MYSVGDKIVHPMHGAVVIDSIVERKIDRTIRQYYVLKMPVGGMVIMVPVDNSEEIGMRSVIDSRRADEVISSLASIEVDMTQSWNKRYRENVLRIKSGDLDEVIKVVKGLMMRDAQCGLSTGERRILNSAKQILISELVLAKNASFEEIESHVNQAVGCDKIVVAE